VNITTLTLISAIAAAGSAVAAFIAALIAVKQLKAIFMYRTEKHMTGTAEKRRLIWLM